MGPDQELEDLQAALADNVFDGEDKAWAEGRVAELSGSPLREERISVTDVTDIRQPRTDDRGVMAKIAGGAGQMMTAVSELMGGKTGGDLLEAQEEKSQWDVDTTDEWPDEGDADLYDDQRVQEAPVAIQAPREYLGGDREGALIARGPGMPAGPGVVQPYRHTDPSEEYAINAYMAHGKTLMAEGKPDEANVAFSKAREIQGAGTSSNAYNDLADLQWKRVHDKFKEKGHPVTRAESGGLEAGLEAMGSSIAHMVTGGLSGELEGAGGHERMREALADLEADGTLQGGSERLSDTQMANPGASLTGGILGAFAPGAALGAFKGAGAVTGTATLGGRVGQAALGSAGFTAGENLVRTLGSKLHGEPHRTPTMESAGKEINDALVIGGGVGGAFEGLASRGTSARADLRRSLGPMDPRGKLIQLGEEAGVRPGFGKHGVVLSDDIEEAYTRSATTGISAAEEFAAGTAPKVGKAGAEYEAKVAQLGAQRREAYYATDDATKPVRLGELAREMMATKKARAGSLFQDESFDKAFDSIVEVVEDPAGGIVKNRGGGSVMSAEQARHDYGIETEAATVWVGPREALPNHRALDASIDALDRKVRYDVAQTQSDPATDRMAAALRKIRKDNQPAYRVKEIDEIHEMLNTAEGAKKALGVGRSSFEEGGSTQGVHAQWQSIEAALPNLLKAGGHARGAMYKMLEEHPDVLKAVKQYVGTMSADALRSGMGIEALAAGKTAAVKSTVSKIPMYLDPIRGAFSRGTGQGGKVGVAAGNYPSFADTPSKRANFEALAAAVMAQEAGQ